MDEPIYLRALEASDVDRCYKWHNDSSLYEMLGGPFHFISKQAVESWVERKTSYSAHGSDEVSLAICVRGEDKHIGNLYLRQINWIARNAELQIYIGEPDERSKGYGKVAVVRLLAYAFRDLGLRLIYLYVLSDNSPAIRTYEKIGFKIEGELRNRVFKQGDWKDMIVMAICTEDLVVGRFEEGEVMNNKSM